MRLILAVVVAGIVYGTLYPFDFSTAAATPAAVEWFLGSWNSLSGKGDIIGNILLFAPLGFFTVLVLEGGGSGGRILPRLAVAALLAALFSFILQMAQLALPTRYASIADTWWNMAGAVLGAGLAMTPPARLLVTETNRIGKSLGPVVLVGCWILSRLAPYVPSLDLQLIKDSLKPLLLRPQIIWLHVLHDAIAWMTVACLLRVAFGGGRGAVLVMAAVAVTFAAQLLIVANWLTASDVAGVTLGLALWWGLLARMRRPAAWLAPLLLLLLAAGTLMPLVPRSAPAPFNLVPFAAFLGPDLVESSRVMFAKLFFYGSLVWLARSIPWPAPALVIAAGACHCRRRDPDRSGADTVRPQLSRHHRPHPGAVRRRRPAHAGRG